MLNQKEIQQTLISGFADLANGELNSAGEKSREVHRLLRQSPEGCAAMESVADFGPQLTEAHVAGMLFALTCMYQLSGGTLAGTGEPV